MDNLLWELKPEHKVLQKRAPLTPVVFEQGQEQKGFWMSFTAKHLPKKLPKPFSVSGKEERAGLRLMLTIHQLSFSSLF